MPRLIFHPSKQREFLEQVRVATGQSWEALGRQVGVCGRTLADAYREKYNLEKTAAEQLSRISGVSLPQPSEIRPDYWSVAKAASAGGRVVARKYGGPGTPEGRSLGGKRSQELRRKYPDKYPNVVQPNSFIEPALTPKLAELIGIILGDGNLTSRQVKVYINAQEDQYVQYICGLFREVFGASTSVGRKDAVCIIVVSGVKLIEALHDLGMQVGDKVRNGATVPGWVFSDPALMAACLRGLIDTDGNIARKNYHARTLAAQITFSNASRPLLESAHRLFCELGYQPTRISCNQIHLTRWGDVQRYVREIGFSNGKHLTRFNGYLMLFGGRQ